jgi:hypothetical protein
VIRVQESNIATGSVVLFVKECVGQCEFRDEAWFHLNGYINSQNSQLWSAENPHAVIQSPLHSVEIGVWCAISRKRIVGPLFFGETINAERYQNLLTQFIALLEENERDCWLQQDGVFALLGGGGGAARWPPRFPDLTPVFFLWGCLKVYRNLNTTLKRL